MSFRRRSTVHDLASLRLHPDGSRVASFAGPSSEVNETAKPTLDKLDPVAKRAKSTRSAAYTTRDIRGNWIAKDAGGVGKVKGSLRVGDGNKEKGKRRMRSVSQEVIDIDLGIEPEKTEGSSGEEEIERDTFKDLRARKRRKFYQDLTFLKPLSSATPEGRNIDDIEPEYSGSTLPLPSSELLKCIHFFAAEYYTRRGRLFDAARESRREQKKKATETETRKSRASSEEIGDEGSSSDTQEETQPGVANDKSVESIKNTQERKKKEKVRDMYRAFDGSALMAIGMLLQEHIVEQVTQNPSEEWISQMEDLEKRERSRATVSSKEAVRGGKRRIRGPRGMATEKMDEVNVSLTVNSATPDKAGTRENQGDVASSSENNTEGDPSGMDTDNSNSDDEQ